MAEIEDGDPAFPCVCFEFDRDLDASVGKWPYRPISYGGASFRDHLVAQVLAHLKTEGLLFMEAGGERRERVVKIVDIAEELADEYPRRRAERMKGGQDEGG